MEDIRQTLADRGICVVIPTYNNGGTIGHVVEDVMQYCRDIIVVNDGSTDNTTATLDKTDGITVVTIPKNKGKGHALKKGFKKALEMGFSYAITIDGDGQHYAYNIADMLRANRQHPGALIVGSRKMDSVERSKGSSFANKFSNFWLWVQTGVKLPDTQSGYRLYPLKKIKSLPLFSSRYEAEVELLVIASWHGVKLVSTPIDVYYPPKEERVSHFRPTADFVRISILNTLLCALAIVYGLPLRLWRGFMRIVRTVYSLLFFSFMAFVVVKPYIWLYTKLVKDKEKQRRKAHKVIYNSARGIMLVHGIPGTRFTYDIAPGTDFDKPKVIICNHQSHLDLTCQLIFTPNIVFLTNNWVWNNPFYGFLIRTAEYYPVADGLGSMLPNLKSLADRGYSIAVFPEGTRSKTCEIGRFHQGAFYIAEQLGLDVLPMYLYGPGKILPKKTYSLNKGPIHIEVGPTITREELQAMGTLKQQASQMRRHYKQKYEEMANRIEQDV